MSEQTFRRLRTALFCVLLALTVVAGVSRFAHLNADQPYYGDVWDGGYLGDEGLWYRSALWYSVRGDWYRNGSYNPSVLVPVMPMLATVASELSGMEMRLSLARGLTAAIVLSAIVAVGLLVGWSCGAWPGLFTALLLASSYALFVQSRLAMLDAPASAIMIVSLALLLAFRDKRPMWATFVAAVIAVIAVLTKSTMLMAVPALLVAAWMAPGTGARWRDPLVLLLTGAAMLGAYGLAVISLFPEDVAMFRATNVSPREVTTLEAFSRYFASLPRLGLWLLLLFVVCVPLGWWGLPRGRHRAWIVSGLVWICLISLALVWKGYVPTRYMVPMLWPIVVVVGAVTGVWVSSGGRQLRRPWAVAAIAMLFVPMGLGGVQIARSLTKPHYTFHDAADHVRRLVDAAGGAEHVAVIGRWPSEAVGLAAGVPSMGMFMLHFAPPEQFDAMLERQPVACFITWNEERFDPEPIRVLLERRYTFGETHEMPILTGLPYYEERPIRVIELHPKDAPAGDD